MGRSPFPAASTAPASCGGCTRRSRFPGAPLLGDMLKGRTTYAMSGEVKKPARIAIDELAARRRDLLRQQGPAVAPGRGRPLRHLRRKRLVRALLECRCHAPAARRAGTRRPSRGRGGRSPKPARGSSRSRRDRAPVRRRRPLGTAWRDAVAGDDGVDAPAHFRCTSGTVRARARRYRSIREPAPPGALPRGGLAGVAVVSALRSARAV